MNTKAPVRVVRVQVRVQVGWGVRVRGYMFGKTLPDELDELVESIPVFVAQKPPQHAEKPVDVCMRIRHWIAHDIRVFENGFPNEVIDEAERRAAPVGGNAV